MAKMMWAAALVAVVLFCAPVIAPDLQSREPRQTASPGALDSEGLRQVLDNMGLEPKALSKGFLVAIKRDGWTYNINLVLSADNTKLGFTSNLGGVENPDSVTAAQWRNLLTANEDVDPSFFYFSKEQKKVYLHRVLDNNFLTPAYLRLQVDNFCANIKDTANLWNFTK